MKTIEKLTMSKSFSDELNRSELIAINGGEDGDLAYIIGYSYTFVTAHILTGGLSTIYYICRKLAG